MNLNLSVAADPLFAWLPDAGAEEIAATPDLILGGALFPSGNAVPADGGYRVTGQWAFVSGCHHAKWLLVVAVLLDEDGHEPQLDEEGRPNLLVTFVPADEATIVDTWHTLGMRGTGSHDIKVSDVFVPARRTALMAPLETPGAAYQGPLYRLTIWTGIALLAPPALGIVRAAVDDFGELARTKTQASPQPPCGTARWCSARGGSRGAPRCRRSPPL